MTLPSYRMTELLATGTSCEIHRGTRVADDLPVVLKVLTPAYPPPERIARLKHEFETTRRVEAPGVIKAHELTTLDYRWAIVLEDIGGESLDRVLPRQKLPLGDLLQLGAELAEAIGQVHRAGIIHKDVNPSNVVWNRATGQLRLIDLGIATGLSRESAALGNPDVLEGTLPYVSPEQTGRMNRALDYRTDFYSLGVVLYEMLTGRLPFSTTDPMELVHCHIARQPSPPHQVRPDIPAPVSDLVMKLMAKSAEARYQSAPGIAADLRECRSRLAAGGEVRGFTLGQSDVIERFHVPEKLYGRERETAELMDAFERVASDRASLMLVSGYSGIGKSMLVRELYRPITARRGYFIAGKFDQLQRGTPYSAVVTAFRSLTRQILGERDAQVASFREELRAALGPNGRVITEVIPELELLLGPQPPVPTLGPVESQNRFAHVFRSAVHVFARPAHPLVLFLDDLQWADSASLNLLDVLMSDDELSALLLIGAYRDNEVGATHPLSLALEALRKKGASIQQIHLSPLGGGHVARLVADTVGAEGADVHALAELVERKTGGNPLFVSELLKAVHEDGLLTFDPAARRFRWDVAHIEARGLTDNIVEFMLGKVRRLPLDTQAALRLAACIGSEFDLGTLAVILERPLARAAADLGPAIREGLVLPAAAPELSAPGADAPLLVLRYRFLHDRVQHAAYDLIQEAERRGVHLLIGRLMLASTTPETRADRIFDLVSHLNLGRSLIEGPAERIELCRLDLEAARKAKAALAYAAAADHLAAALELVTGATWEEHYDLAFALIRERAEVLYLKGDYEAAEAAFALALSRARTPIEKADVHGLMVDAHTLLGRYAEALAAGRAGLSLLGITVPEDDLLAAVNAEFGEVQRSLEATPLASLLERAPMTDPVAKSAMALLNRLTSSTFYLDRLLYGIVIFKAVRMALQHGPSPETSDLYAYYGHMVGGVFGKRPEGYEAGKVALRLADRFGHQGNKCGAAFIFTNFIQPWNEHLRASLPLHDAGFGAGLAGGEHRFAGYILVYKSFNELFEGKPLSQALAHLREHQRFNEKGKNQLGVDTLLGIEIILGNLSGATPDRLTFAAGALTEAEFLAACVANQSIMAIAFYQVFKIAALYLYGEHAAALEASVEAEKYLSAIMGSYAVTLHNVYTSLSLAALYPTATPEEQAKHRERLAANQAALGQWAEDCPENFAHLHALVEAEVARVTGDTTQALTRYDEAIAGAREKGFVHHEALASELTGRFWLARGNDHIARGFLTAALYGYRLWGARHKVEELRGRHAALLLVPAVEAAAAAPIKATDRTATEALDLISVIKACQVISGEIVLDRLLGKLMAIVIENAGAERGVLILARKGELLVQMDTGVDTAEARRGGLARDLPVPLADYPALAESVVNYVARAHGSVLEENAARDGAFARDPYVERYRLQSILCTPLVSQGQLLGMLYLENNLGAGVFTRERLEFLRLLSSQIAISIENARLYDEMEQRVNERTEQLRSKNRDLEAALGDLREAQSQLVRAEKMASLGQLSAGLAHELKNPLNFVNNFAELNEGMLRDLVDESQAAPGPTLADSHDVLADLHTNEQKILHHGRRADAIIRSLMGHARGGVGARQPTALNAFVDQYVKVAVHGVPRHEASVTLVHDYDDSIGDVSLVPDEMSRVVVNLMNNALYAVRERKRAAGAAHEPTVTVSTRRRGDQVEIRVTDNGTGVPASLHHKIFEPFFTTKPAGAGTGLGLSLSYEIVVNGHGGALTVESGEGQGATFVVSIPSGTAAAAA